MLHRRWKSRRTASRSCSRTLDFSAASGHADVKRFGVGPEFITAGLVFNISARSRLMTCSHFAKKKGALGIVDAGELEDEANGDGEQGDDDEGDDKDE